MKTLSNLLVMILGISAPLAVSRAAVFERDWKAPGDGLLTYDDVNQREWLDISVTLAANLPAGFKFDDVVLETKPGGLFEGFEVASQAELEELATSSGITLATNSFELNGSPTLRIIELLRGDDASIVSGLIEETFSIGPNFPRPHAAGDFFYNSRGAEAGLKFRFARGDGFPAGDLPVYLYRQVPEPTAHLFASLAVLIGISRIRPDCSHFFSPL